MLNFIKGAPEKPSGNLLIFSEVKGKNPFHPRTRLIVANVVVSFVSASSNSFPVVIFPPGPLFTQEELDILIELNDNYDVIQVHDYEQPENVKEKSYIRQRMKHLNECVYQYVELCQKHLSEKIDDLNIEEIPLIDEQYDPFPLVEDESEALEILDDWVKNSDEELLPGKPPIIQNAIDFLRSHHSHYDVERLEGLSFEKPDEKTLARLYVAKFQAVYNEHYEIAARIKQKIERLEKTES